MLRIIPIDSGSVVPVDYSHSHDKTLVFKKYTENFDFGLRINDYYFNQNPKDKKTNFDTQYVLTDLYSLSTIAELDTPFTTQAVSSFTTTIKHGDTYIRTISDNATSTVLKTTTSTSLCTLCSDYFFTFNLTSVPTSINPTGSENHEPRVERVYITQVLSGTTYYLSGYNASSPTGTGDGKTAIFTTTAPTTPEETFRYILEGDTITLHTDNADKKRIHFNGSILQLSGSDPTNNFTTIANLSSSNLTINRNLLTYKFKDIPNTYTKYVSSYNNDIVDVNTSTSVQHISNNYFVFGNNYKFNYNKEESSSNKNIVLNADIFPLKNQATNKEYYSEANHFNSEPSYLNRIYEKINAGSNQIHGYDKIGLSYNIGTYDISFKANKLTYFTTPSSMAPYTTLNIQDSKIDNLGAVPGDSPLMSDKVFKRREIIKSNNFGDDVNATYLCSWLSGNNEGGKKWVDRYYNPQLRNFTGALSAGGALSGTTFYEVVCSVSASTTNFSTEVFDVSSSLSFEPNNDYIYYHIGDNDYKNLFDAYTLYNTASSVEYLTYKGIPSITQTSKDDIILPLNGNNFGRFSTDIQGDFSINFWLETSNYTKPFCHKLLGNYFDEGIGVFNTDLVTPNILLPQGSRVVFYNNDFEEYDSITVKEQNNPVNVKAIGRRDNYSDLFILGENNVIYVYNNNGNLVSKITNLSGSDVIVDDFEVGEKDIHVLFNPVSAKNYFRYNTATNTTHGVVSSDPVDTNNSIGKIFNFNTGTSILTADGFNSYGNEVAWAPDNETPWIIKQENTDHSSVNYNYLQKGIQTSTSTNRVNAGLEVNSAIEGVIIDDEYNVIVLHDGDRISILDENRKLKKIREFCKFVSPDAPKYIDLIYDFEGGKYKKYILLIQYSGASSRMFKIDYNTLQITKIKNIGRLNSLRLTKTVTTYSYLKKIGANKSRIKVVMKTKPRFTETGVFEKQRHVVDFDATQLNPGYNHFFINASLRKGYLELFINGKSAGKAEFSSGKYLLDNVLGAGFFIGAVSTPYYFTLANRLRQPRKYFVNNSKIKAFKLYNKTMSYFDMLAHYNYHIGDKDVVWGYPIGQRTYIDTIDKLMKFNLPEKISNDYEICINNTKITDSKLKGKVAERIKEELPKITPYFSTVKDIKIT